MNTFSTIQKRVLFELGASSMDFATVESEFSFNSLLAATNAPRFRISYADAVYGYVEACKALKSNITLDVDVDLVKKAVLLLMDKAFLLPGAQCHYISAVEFQESFMWIEVPERIMPFYKFVGYLSNKENGWNDFSALDDPQQFFPPEELDLCQRQIIFSFASAIATTPDHDAIFADERYPADFPANAQPGKLYKTEYYKDADTSLLLYTAAFNLPNLPHFSASLIEAALWHLQMQRLLVLESDAPHPVDAHPVDAGGNLHSLIWSCFNRQAIEITVHPEVLPFYRRVAELPWQQFRLINSFQSLLEIKFEHN